MNTAMEASVGMTDAAVDTTLFSKAAISWNKRICEGALKGLTGLDLVIYTWNNNVEDECRDLVQTTTRAASTTIKKGYKRVRRAFWQANVEDLHTALNMTDEGLIERIPPSVVRAVAVTETQTKAVVASLSLERSPLFQLVATSQQTPPKTTGLSHGAKPTNDKASEVASLSVTQQELLRRSMGTGFAPVVDTSASSSPGPDVTDWAKLVEETEANEREYSNFILWACTRASDELKKLTEKSGEDVWTNPITVETYSDQYRYILVRSSTAPMFGTHGPIIRHDFRANNRHVNNRHPNMLRQADGQKLIRSKKVNGQDHEYYCKGMQYKEGAFFVGFFVSNGADQDDLARYYVCRNGKIERISKDTYETLENLSAAGQR